MKKDDDAWWYSSTDEHHYFVEIGFDVEFITANTLVYSFLSYHLHGNS